MYIYGDLFLIVNIVINTVIIVLTGLGAGIKLKGWRVLTAAVFGSLYALFGLTGDYALWYNPAAKIFVSVAIVFAAFPIKSLRLLGIAVACFYTVSFFLGGAVIGWLMLFKQDILGPGGSISILSLNWRHLAVGVLAAVTLALAVFSRIKTVRERRGLLMPVTIENDGRHVQLTALLDTGNRLFAGSRPVIIVSLASIEPVLGGAVIKYLRQTSHDMWIANLTGCEDVNWLSKIEVIPYRAVGLKNMLLGFRPDEVRVLTENGEIKSENVAIGILSGNLVADGSYQALLHPEVIHGVNTKGGTDICA